MSGVGTQHFFGAAWLHACTIMSQVGSRCRLSGGNPGLHSTQLREVAVMLLGASSIEESKTPSKREWFPSSMPAIARPSSKVESEPFASLARTSSVRRRKLQRLGIKLLHFQHDGQNTCGFTEMPVKPVSQKYFSLPKSRNRRIHSPSRPHEGRFAIVTIRGAGCDGRFDIAGDARSRRTVKPCGPDPPTLGSSRSRWSIDDGG